MEFVWAISLVLLSLVFWSLNVFGLPGNWLLVAATALYAWWMPAESRADIGTATLTSLIVLAGLGELVEFLAGAWGAKRAGGSRRAAVLALVGSLMGSILGLFVGIPIPLVGPIVGALLFAGLGALGGAVLGESWKGRSLNESLSVGEAAFWGRILGTLGKMMVGTLLVAIVLIAVFT